MTSHDLRAMLMRYQILLRAIHGVSPNTANFEELNRIRKALESLPAPEPAGLRNAQGSVD